MRFDACHLILSLVIVTNLFWVHPVVAEEMLFDLADLVAPTSVNPSGVTLGGYSSGACFAHQFHIIYSSVISGVGLLAATPYASLDFWTLLWTRLPPSRQSIPKIIRKIRFTASLHRIDETSNLQKDKVFIFHGGLDTIFKPANAFNVKRVYEAFKSNRSEDIQVVIKSYFGHIWPTSLPMNNDCCWSYLIPNMLQNAPAERYCDYDTVFHMFTHLYGPVAASRPASSPSGPLRHFNQNSLSTPYSGLDSIGTIYIPKQCENGAICKLHLVFHGCREGREVKGDVLATNTEYMLWADVWDVILVFPNVKKTFFPFNPNGCWEVMGYTGKNYAFRSGKQVQAIKAMIDTVLKQRRNS